MSPGRGERALWLLAPALLTAVAAGQHLIAAASDLSAWKGGGFGMFSTVDSPSARFVRVRLRVGDAEYAVAVPDSLAVPERIALTWPNHRHAAELARRLAGLRWVTAELPLAALPPGTAADPASGAQGGTAVLLRLYKALAQDESSPPGTDPLPVEAVRVAVWRYTFDGTTAGLTAEKVVESVAATPGSTR